MIRALYWSMFLLGIALILAAIPLEGLWGIASAVLGGLLVWTSWALLLVAEGRRS